jgi:predicted amidophosphoribosyltransferase
VWTILRDVLFPISCIVCGRGALALCRACGPAEADAEQFVIAGIDARAAGAYAGSLREAIVAMKRGERDQLGALAPLLARELGSLTDPLVPLPTSPRRRRARGFDQAVELAARAAAINGITVCELLEKRGAAQHGRSRSGRLHARGRFRVRRGIVLPPRVTLVDDVCTTGATLGDAADALFAAGITVGAAVFLARTPPARKPSQITAG